MALLKSDVNIFRLQAELQHVCFIVRDMSDAMKQYSTLFNVSRWYRVKMNHYEIYYRDKPIKIEWDIVMGYSGRLQIELISIIHSDGPNIYSDILGKDGEGFHHLCASVNNLDKLLPLIRQAGIEVIQHGVTYLSGGSLGRYAYIDIRKLCGCILELLETRLYGIKVINSEWMLRLGTVVGSVEGISL